LAQSGAARVGAGGVRGYRFTFYCVVISIFWLCKVVLGRSSFKPI